MNERMAAPEPEERRTMPAATRTPRQSAMRGNLTATDTTAGFTHGLSAYHNRKCRCRTCKDANNAYMRRYLPGYRNGVRGGTKAEVRTWARAHGYRVSDRGRGSLAVSAAYAAAHR